VDECRNILLHCNVTSFTANMGKKPLTGVHYLWLLVLPHYIFLKCYNFLLFKIFFTKGIDSNTLQTQESSW
jgi:hypothetical protein